MTPFESIEHISEPVITKSVEAKNMDDLPKLIETLQQVAKEDPTIRVEINEDTGEHLISGQGELHLEVITQRIQKNQGIPVVTGEPIVVYREAPQKESREVEGVSPNRHNKFYITVEPLSEDIIEQIQLGEVSMDMPELERREALQEAGMDKDTSQNVEHIHGTNILIDDTKGIQHLNETMELVIEGLEEALDDGPLAAEPARVRCFRLHDASFTRTPSTAVPRRLSRQSAMPFTGRSSTPTSNCSNPSRTSVSTFRPSTWVRHPARFRAAVAASTTCTRKVT